MARPPIEGLKIDFTHRDGELMGAHWTPHNPGPCYVVLARSSNETMVVFELGKRGPTPVMIAPLPTDVSQFHFSTRVDPRELERRPN